MQLQQLRAPGLAPKLFHSRKPLPPRAARSPAPAVAALCCEHKKPPSAASSGVEASGTSPRQQSNPHQLQPGQEKPSWPLLGGLAAACSLLVEAAAAAAPALAQDQGGVQQLAVLAAAATAGFKVPWPVTLLGLGAVNIIGLNLVLQFFRSWQDGSAPCTLVKMQFALRLSDSKLQNQLRQLGDMIKLGQQGSWLILEEFVLLLTQSQRSLVYADVVSSLTNVSDGYEQFKRIASNEAAAAVREEAEHVKHGEKPEAIKHRGALGRLLGAPPTEDLEERQQVLLLTFVLAARGFLDIPAIKDWKSARHALQQVCGLSSSAIMGVELLWTPESPEDFLSEAQLMEDHPYLVELHSGKRISELMAGSLDEADWAGGSSMATASLEEPSGWTMRGQTMSGVLGSLPPQARVVAVNGGGMQGPSEGKGNGGSSSSSGDAGGGSSSGPKVETREEIALED